MKFSLAAVAAFVAAAAALPQGSTFPPPPPGSGGNGGNNGNPPSPPGWGGPGNGGNPPPPPDDPYHHDHPHPPPPRNNGFHLQIVNAAWSGYNNQPLIVNGDQVSGINYLQPGDFAETFQLNNGYLYYGGESNDGSIALWGGQSALAIGKGFTPFIMANSNGNRSDSRGLSFWNGVSFSGQYLTINGQSRWAMCYIKNRWAIGWVTVDQGRGPTCYSVSIVQYNQFNGGPPGAWNNSAKKTEGRKLPALAKATQ